MLPRQWVGCCNHINTYAKPRPLGGVFCLPIPDITLDISETRQQVHDGKLWLGNSIYAILCAIFYDVLYNGAQNFHFLLVKGDALIEYLAFWR